MTWTGVVYVLMWGVIFGLLLVATVGVERGERGSRERRWRRTSERMTPIVEPSYPCPICGDPVTPGLPCIPCTTAYAEIIRWWRAGAPVEDTQVEVDPEGRWAHSVTAHAINQPITPTPSENPT